MRALLVALVACAAAEEPQVMDSAVDGSRCTATTRSVRCAHETLAFDVAGERREVHYQVPRGAPPEGGWPAIVLFQGSYVSAELTWRGEQSDPYGLLFQARTVHALLDAGYAVITPEAHLDGTSWWDTNIAPWIVAWDGAPDDQLMEELFAALDDGRFGAIDPARLYAGGLSSGGYMTSRAVVAYPGRFRAAVIVSGSWMTCAGWVCAVPRPLPAEHPPTLFLHGALDTVVPVYTMQAYAAQLERQGIDVRVVIDPNVWHGWIPAAPAEVLEWLAHAP